MQSGNPGNLEPAGDDLFTGTMDSGIVTLQPGPGTMGADASTPVLDSLIGSALLVRAGSNTSHTDRSLTTMACPDASRTTDVSLRGLSERTARIRQNLL